MNTRDERQAESIAKIINNNYNGILNLAPRFGKTRIGVLACKHYKQVNSKTAIVLVPNVSIKSAWEQEFATYEQTEIPVATASQIVSIRGFLRVGLLIVDEAHRFTSDVWYKLINNDIIKYDKIIMLTGSLPIGDNLLKLTKLASIIDYISEEEAISNNWISNYIEYNIPLKLSDDETIKYVSNSTKISLLFQKYKGIHNSITYGGTQLFDSEMSLLYGCTKGANSKIYGHISSDLIIDAICNKMTFNEESRALWNKDTVKAEARLFSNIVKNRNYILTNSKVKLEAVIYMLSVLKKSAIVFSDNSMFADKLSEEYNKLYPNKSVSYHSNLESKPLIDLNTGDYYRYATGKRKGEPKLFSVKAQLEYIKACFQVNYYNVIFAVKSLDEGVTIPNIEIVITTSGSSNPIQYVQRTGRGKTYVNETKLARIYNLYFDDFTNDGVVINSRDRSKLMDRQAYSKNVIKISIDEV